MLRCFGSFFLPRTLWWWVLIVHDRSPCESWEERWGNYQAHCSLVPFLFLSTTDNWTGNQCLFFHYSNSCQPKISSHIQKIQKLTHLAHLLPRRTATFFEMAAIICNHSELLARPFKMFFEQSKTLTFFGPKIDIISAKKRWAVFHNIFPRHIPTRRRVSPWCFHPGWYMGWVLIMDPKSGWSSPTTCILLRAPLCPVGAEPPCKWKKWREWASFTGQIWMFEMVVKYHIQRNIRRP